MGKEASTVGSQIENFGNSALPPRVNFSCVAAIVTTAPNLYKVLFETKKEKLAQYGKRIFNLTGTDEAIAHQAITETIAFFHTMGMETKLSDYTKDYEKAANFIVNRFEERGWKALGERQNITLEKVREIVEQSY